MTLEISQHVRPAQPGGETRPCRHPPVHQQPVIGDASAAPEGPAAPARRPADRARRRVERGKDKRRFCASDQRSWSAVVDLAVSVEKPDLNLMRSLGQGLLIQLKLKSNIPRNGRTRRSKIRSDIVSNHRGSCRIWND